MSKQMTVEMSVRRPDGRGYYSASIDLPALNLELEDAKQRARLYMYPESETYFYIYESGFGDMENVSMTGTSLEELNFLAKRMDSLSDEEAMVFDTLYERLVETNSEAAVTVKDLINMTYGLDAVPIASNVGNDYELGRFVVENSFDERFDDLPESMLQYLDYNSIGKEFRERDNGAFCGRFYVPTCYYEPQMVYDGEHIPRSDGDNAVFRLLVAKAPEENPDEVLNHAKWLNLPVKPEQLEAFAEELGADSIHDCVFYEFQSSIPQIDAEMFQSMKNIDMLNNLASDYLNIGMMGRLKFKAVMEAVGVSTLNDATNAMFDSDYYKFSFAEETPEEFFKTYLAYHMPTDFDIGWLNGIDAYNIADTLIDRLEAHVTPYGIVSDHYGSLFDLVPFDKPVEVKAEAMIHDKYELIEVCGRSALFSDARIPDSAVPEGLYRYDLRCGDNDYIDGTIEPKVYVDHGGSILVQQPFEFGEDGYIQLDEDSSPNFTGEEMTAEEFASRNFTQDDDEDFEQNGGMSL